jgi:hypothetical protein
VLLEKSQKGKKIRNTTTKLLPVESYLGAIRGEKKRGHRREVEKCMRERRKRNLREIFNPD